MVTVNKGSHPVRKPKRVVERNIALLGDLMQFLLAESKVLASLPSDLVGHSAG